MGRGDLLEVCKNTLSSHELVESGQDLIVLANYDKILKREDYDCRYGAINCHRGRLPQYRGSSVLNWQIINGEIKGGVSIIQVDEGIDTGDILGEGVFDILLTDTIVEVRQKAHLYIHELLPRIVMKIRNGTMKSLKQSDVIRRVDYEPYIAKAAPCYWHHRKPEDSRILWDKMTALQGYNLVRASESPYEAFCFRGSEFYLMQRRTQYITKAKLLNDNFSGVAGRVVRHLDNGSVVICKDRGVWVNIDIPIGEQLW
jgi:methionyl-tRNA formyltransferase